MSKDAPINVDLCTSLHMATWNILTLTNTGHGETFCHELSKCRDSIAIITDVHLTGRDHMVIDSGADDAHVTFYRAVLGIVILSVRLSVRPLSVCPSVTRVLFDETTVHTADILIAHERVIILLF